MRDDAHEKGQLAHENGGILIEEEEDRTRVILAIDPKNPQLIFDRINEIEIDLVRQANNNLEKIRRASEWVDDLRKNVWEQLKSVGIDTEG